MLLDKYIIKPPKVKAIDRIYGIETCGDAIRITNNYHITVRKAMYQLALYFKREFSYDFTQYCASGLENDDECHGYMWIIDDYLEKFAIGGCCFRRRKYRDYPEGWGMQWIWIHPFFRNKGLLARSWNDFEKKYGLDFHCEPPLSHAMQYFLKNRNYDLHTKGFKN